MPPANKALILCNGTLTFHGLPELSPASTPKAVNNCLWIGGSDLDESGTTQALETSAMMALRAKIRVLRAGENISVQKTLDYPGCLAAARRSKYACVADARSYSLVDLDNLRKIPLFPISSLDDTAISASERQVHTSLTSPEPRGASGSRLRGGTGVGDQSHGRNTSLSALVTSQTNALRSGLTRRSNESRPRSHSRSDLGTPEPRSGTASPVRPSSMIGSLSGMESALERPLPALPPETSPERLSARGTETTEFLQPHILSPSPSEFLLFTGTKNAEPGVGIFVNMDGDVVRGTLELSKFPRKVVVDGSASMSDSTNGQMGLGSEGFVLAAIEPLDSDIKVRGIEVVRWDSTEEPTTFLDLPYANDIRAKEFVPTIGVASPRTTIEVQFPEVGRALRSRMLSLKKTSQPFESSRENKGHERVDPSRDAQEDEFALRLGQAQAQTLAWCDNKIFWAVRTPTLLRIENSIQRVIDDCKEARLDQGRLIRIMKDLRGIDARSETEFLSLEYVKQKISIILFADLAVNRDDVNPQLTEQLLMDAKADPRLILSMIPFLRKDIFQGPEGIWTHAGLVEMMQESLKDTVITLEPDEVLSRPEDFDVIGLVKRYLSSWRQKKGFGSIPDEMNVFATIDAALLHVLLFQDQQSHLGPGSSSTVRVELYAIVDNPVNCFDRAIELLEEYHRLYVLSRLYQSRRMASKVLETWRRILEGAHDDGGGFSDGENEVRKYLLNRTDRALVEEYGTWLAERNPQLGVQVFSDEASKVKFTADGVVKLLRERAPDAVKVYLEHLVFGKKSIQYADKLISYYLDSVLSALSSPSTSEDAISLLSSSYKTYRSLSAPKPTYRDFLTTPSSFPVSPTASSWWHDRLRLLELLGGSHGTAFTYDIPAVLSRIKPFSQSLVPESIILEGRQGHHTEALSLLTHGLGDYHTAINYCLLSGSSIFHPATPGTSSTRLPQELPSHEQQSTLFTTLLTEFLLISSPAARLEQSCLLLTRFAPWFDIASVLQQLPEEWAVGAVRGFLESALREIVSEKNESMVVRHLAGAENLRVVVEGIEKMEGLGPTIVRAYETPDSGTGAGGFEN